MRLFAALLASATCAACATVTVGTITVPGQAAHLAADPRFNAGLPVTVSLRKIDEIEVGTFYSRALLAPGDHRLLVDCSVQETQSTTRFELDLAAAPGAHYRLIAKLAPGNRNCEDVQVEVR